MTRESIDKPEARLLGQALKILRSRAGKNQAEAGEAFGVTGEGWRKYEAGASKSIFNPSTQSKLAAAVNSTVDDLLVERARLAGDDLPTPARNTPTVAWTNTRQNTQALLPIRDRVQAGAWLAADDTGQVQPATYPAIQDQRFSHAQQWLSEVVGDSVNLLNICEGDLIHCVSAIDINYYPRTGDIVEVERIRFGGQERELTVKQVEVTMEGIQLWPRSSNPRWRTPLIISDDLAEGEEAEVAIRALVVAAIRKF